MSNISSADSTARPLPSNLLGEAWSLLSSGRELNSKLATIFGLQWPAQTDWRERLGARIAAATGADEVKFPTPKPKKAKAKKPKRTKAWKATDRRSPQPHKQSGKARKDDGFYSSREWKELRYQALAKMTRRCMCCGWEPRDGQGSLHVDHILPRSKFPGRALDLSNLQILCADCNRGKSNISYEDWRDYWPELAPPDE